MIDVDKIEDAMIQTIKSSSAVIKTVEPYEANFDSAQVSQLLLLTPFALVHYAGLNPIEEQRLHTFGAGVVEQDFDITIGSKSLRSRREGQLGCYAILAVLRTIFDGVSLVIDGVSLGIGLLNEAFIYSEGGLIVYRATYRTYQQ